MEYQEEYMTDAAVDDNNKREVKVDETAADDAHPLKEQCKSDRCDSFV